MAKRNTKKDWTRKELFVVALISYLYISALKMTAVVGGELGILFIATLFVAAGISFTRYL